MQNPEKPQFDEFSGTGMCEERYDALMNNPELTLTAGEQRAGWYWSPAWDGMLVHRSWAEARYDYPTTEEMP